MFVVNSILVISNGVMKRDANLQINVTISEKVRFLFKSGNVKVFAHCNYVYVIQK